MSGDAAVHARQQPRRRALEHEQPLDARRDLGNELRRRRSRADHRDAATRQVVVVVPARRVKARPGEALQAGDLRRDRVGQRAHARDEEPRVDRAGRRRHVPDAGVAVPVAADDLVAEPQVRPEVVLARRGGAGSPRSQPAVSRAASTPGWRRTRTSTDGTRRRRRSPGYELSRQVPPTMSERSRTTKSCSPSCLSRIAMPMPGEPGADDRDLHAWGSSTPSAHANACPAPCHGAGRQPNCTSALNS